MSVLSLVLLGLVVGEQLIDEFHYPTVEVARRAWVGRSGTPPVELAADGQRTVLEVTAPFATDPKLLRTVIDRDVRLNLAAPGEFTLELSSDSPEAFAQLTLYFRSGDGWFASNRSLTGGGWQTLEFSKASFRTEGNPAGWHRIDRIRISAWRGQDKDASLLIRRLSALTHEVALVIPPSSAGQDYPELSTARSTADRVAGLLAELGLGADAVEEPDISQGALGTRRVAVLAYNPGLDDQTAAALGEFVDTGGKLIVCYQLHRTLGAALGFGRTEYLRQQRPGQFAQVRFDATDIAGLPEQVRQASWNITLAEPVGHNARVIGRWYDDKSAPTGHPAMLMSDRGAFFSHIVLSDDREGKKAMLAAVLGELAPPLWEQMARSALDRLANVGHCEDLDCVAAQVAAHGDDAARGQLDSAAATREQAEQQVLREAYPEAVETARRSHDLLAQAYLRAQPSPQREGRAVWNHSGTGAYPGDWDRSASELSAAGLNMVLPNMLWAGLAHYASDVLPRSSTFRQYGDQIAQCTAAAERHGIEVHVWKVNYNLSGAPEDFVEELRRQGRLQVTADGRSRGWLCPSHPDNQRLELESMLEVARNYPVDGLHFDYIRYPDRESCYCAGCRERFEAARGRKVSDWPRDCYSGSLREEYNDWRCRQISALVGAVHREAKRLRPELKISAAVFGGYPACRDSVAQDWPEWVKAGWLDFLCPMDYTNSDLRFTSLLGSQLRLVGGRIPVYPGIGATASNSTLSADRVVGQIHHARSLGADGFCIFNFSPAAAHSIIPGVGLGAGTRRAIPPHSEP